MEALRRQMAIQPLKDRQEEILTQLFEMYEGDTEFLGKLGIEEGLFDKMKQAFKGGWSQEQAEAEFQRSYAPYMQRLVKKLGTDEATIKNALVKFMVDNGGKALIGQNALWNAQTKTFDRPSSVTGGASSPTGGMGGSY